MRSFTISIHFFFFSWIYSTVVPLDQARDRHANRQMDNQIDDKWISGRYIDDRWRTDGQTNKIKRQMD